VTGVATRDERTAEKPDTATVLGAAVWKPEAHATRAARASVRIISACEISRYGSSLLISIAKKRLRGR
jgi:hypothetical protein